MVTKNPQPHLPPKEAKNAGLYHELMVKILNEQFPDLPPLDISDLKRQNPKREKVKKQASLTVRLSREEKEKLTQLAKGCETSLSDLIRNSLAWPPLPEAEADLNKK